MAIKRKLTSVHAPTMNTGRRVASTSTRKSVKAAPAPAAAAPAKAPRKPRTPKTESEKQFDNKRATVLEGRRNGKSQKAGSKSAKERYNERLAKWNEDNKKQADLAKLKRKCFADNLKIAADNRKALVSHAKKALELRLNKRKDILAKTKPAFKDGKLVVPKLSADERKVNIPAKPVRKPTFRVNSKEMKLVEVHPAPRKKHGGIDQAQSKAEKKSQKAHTVKV
jgi:hypothetical protein